jgi:hypothetical protein
VDGRAGDWAATWVQELGLWCDNRFLTFTIIEYFILHLMVCLLCGLNLFLLALRSMCVSGCPSPSANLEVDAFSRD